MTETFLSAITICLHRFKFQAGVARQINIIFKYPLFFVGDYKYNNP